LTFSDLVVIKEVTAKPQR